MSVWIMFMCVVCCYQVLATCFVRKALDYLFTQRELKYLDDIMPEITSRAKEDAKKAKQKEPDEVSTTV